MEADADGRTVGAALVAERLFPGVLSGISQFEPVFHLLQSDARAASVAFGLGVVAVADVAHDFVVGFGQTDVDETLLRGRDAVLEGIFDERDEDERGNRGGGAGPDVKFGFHLDVCGHSDFHQFHVVADEVDLLVQRHGGFLVFIEDVAQQFAEFLHGLLGLIRVEGDEGIDVVERVEQEVRVELAAQVLQFGFGLALDGFPPCRLAFMPFLADFDGHAQAGREDQAGDVAENDEQIGELRVHHVLFGRHEADDEVEPQAEPDGYGEDGQQIDEEKFLAAFLEEKPGDEQKVVEIKNQAEGNRDNEEARERLLVEDASARALHDDERNAEEYAPIDGMDGGFE